MAYSHYDRLSALDATFLAIESPSVHMHVGTVGIFAGSLRTAAGGLDIERIRSLSEPALRENARFRQRLVRVPLFDHWVWVDDEHFELDYHLRHTSLPEPGDMRQLKRLAGRIFSQKLDRGRPLWEMWFVEGLADGRFAIITKVHHCMIDGASGVDLLGGFVTASAEKEAPASGRYVPRPGPRPERLVADELAHRAKLPLRAAAGTLELLRAPRRTLNGIGHAVAAVGHALGAGFGAVSKTPLDVEIGPHRRFDWLRMELADVREAKERFGGTVNDVVLALVAGALRRFFERRGLPVPFQRDLHFRAALPDAGASASEGEAEVLAWCVTELPIAERDPAARVRASVHALREAKHLNFELLAEAGEWVPALFSAFARRQIGERIANLALTPYAGPPAPLHLLGARVLEMVPLLPLPPGQALRVALLSYAGALRIGFSADWDRVPDLHDLVLACEESFHELEALA